MIHKSNGQLPKTALDDLPLISHLTYHICPSTQGTYVSAPWKYISMIWIQLPFLKNFHHINDPNTTLLVPSSLADFDIIKSNSNNLQSQRYIYIYSHTGWTLFWVHCVFIISQAKLLLESADGTQWVTIALAPLWS